MIIEMLEKIISKVEKIFDRNKKGHYIWVGPGKDPFKEKN